MGEEQKWRTVVKGATRGLVGALGTISILECHLANDLRPRDNRIERRSYDVSYIVTSSLALTGLVALTAYNLCS